MRHREAILHELAKEQVKLAELERELSAARRKIDALNAELQTASIAKPTALKSGGKCSDCPNQAFVPQDTMPRGVLSLQHGDLSCSLRIRPRAEVANRQGGR